MNPQDISKLQLEITSYCNSFCPHCPRFDETGELHPDLSLEHWNMEKIISAIDFEKLPNLRDVFIEGDKGDPLMHPKISVLLEKLLSLETRPDISLTSNGCIRDTDWWARLGRMSKQNFQVTFSIDGLEDTYHLYRKGLDYHKTIANAKAFIDAGGHAIWKFLTFKHNQHQISAARELSEKMGFASFRWEPSHVDRFLGQPSWVVKDKDKTYEIYPTDDFSRGTTAKARVGKKKISIVTDRICPNTSQGHVYINYQGMVIPCCMMHFDTKLDYPGKRQLEILTEGLENQSLYYYTLEEVLQNPFFNKNLTTSLKSGNWHFNCERSCAEKIKNNLKASKNDISH